MYLCQSIPTICRYRQILPIFTHGDENGELCVHTACVIQNAHTFLNEKTITITINEGESRAGLTEQRNARGNMWHMTRKTESRQTHIDG